MTETCETCKFSVPTSPHEIGRSDMADYDRALVKCRAQPPAAVYPTIRISVYPVCHADDWCGQYQPKD